MVTASALGRGIEGPARWSLRLFGGFELGVPSGGERVASLGKRERVLLAYLALSPNCRQQRRKLATLLWGDATDETALDNLRTCIWALRKALGDTEHRVIASEGEDILLDAAAFDIDAVAFRLLAAKSGRTELEAAANLYSGELLDGLGIDNDEFESWRRAETSRYRDQAIDVLTRLMTQLGEGGETERAIETGLRILRLEPLHEAAVRRLMRLYGESGRRGAAVQLYRTLADALKSELGAQPEAETRLAFAEIARGGEDLTSDAPVEPSGAAAADAKPPALSTVTAVPSDAPREPLHLTMRPAFRLRASLVVLAGGLILSVALISYRQFALPGTSQAVVAERAASAPQRSAISVAVLPFANVSGDATQEFFSDGMTDEITGVLAKIADFRVVGRTSAFQFKGQNKDLRAIGQALNARYLIDGSVRKEGTHIRITAQLIEADSGVNIWTESYDRELTAVFAIQEDIATAISLALRVPLGLKRGDTLVRNRASDVESHDQYLRAKAMVRARGLTRMTDAAALLEQVVVRDPDFAPAWALLAQAYHFTPTYHPARDNSVVEEYRPVVNASLPKAEVAARRAIQLDPDLADGYLAMGYVQQVRGKWQAAEELYSKALTLDANNPDALHLSGLLLAEVGRVKEALLIRQKLQGLEPFVPVFNVITGLVLWLNAQNDAAIAVLKDVPPGGRSEVPLAMIAAQTGHYKEAAEILLTIPSGLYLPGRIEEAARLLRTAPAQATSPQSLPRLGNLGFVFLYVGAPSRVLEFYEGNAEAGFLLGGIAAPLWHPSYAPARDTERFKVYARKAGLVDYWRARGWPDRCRPKGTYDFACD